MSFVNDHVFKLLQMWMNAQFKHHVKTTEPVSIIMDLMNVCAITDG